MSSLPSVLQNMNEVALQPTTEDMVQDAHSLRDLSETVLGMVAAGLLPAATVEPMWFSTPYDKGAKVLKEGGHKEDLVKVMGSDMLMTMNNKVEDMHIGNAFDWVTALHKAAVAFNLSQVLYRAAHDLERNAPVDLSPVHSQITQFMVSGVETLRRASEVEAEGYQPFQKSGNKYIDAIMGGIPTDGPIVVYGATGVGKSFFGGMMLIDYLMEHTTKIGAAYSFEMSEEHWIDRMRKMYPNFDRVADRLFVSGSINKPNDLVPEVAAHRPDILLLDDMDNMFEGEASPPKYEAVYKVVKKIARLQKIPVIALSQAKERGERAGTFLGKNDAAWSASNERSAALLIALQQAGYMDAGWKGDDTFPITEDPMQYIMFWKSRDGWPLQQGPGAIIMGIEKDEFGRTKSRMWKGPLYEGQPKLHMPRRSAHAFPAAK